MPFPANGVAIRPPASEGDFGLVYNTLPIDDCMAISKSPETIPGGISAS